MQDYYLLVDFGSTFTKLVAVDIQAAQILATAKSYTTIETSIMDGYQAAFTQLRQSLPAPITFSKTLVCSSARGGFKMIAIGLTENLTAEAAKRAALGAGTKILKTYSYFLTDADIQEMISLAPDVILLSGGTDGGNAQTILANAKKLTALPAGIPIVVAGNKAVAPEISELFTESGNTHVLTENVMPKVNVLQAEPTRIVLREIFMQKIIKAKGLEEVEQLTQHPIIPTPTAVLQAARLLSQGYQAEDGIGDLIVVDIGGATTDLHSIGAGSPTDPSTILEGLQEPFAKRTVEGDLGMRYSANSLVEAVGPAALQAYLPNWQRAEIESACLYRTQHPAFVATEPKDIAFDEALAQVAIETAFNRHAGHLRREPTPTRTLYYQDGKDLTQFKGVIGTGGVLVHSQKGAELLRACQQKTEEAMCLKPQQPHYYIDRSYILSAMGLLAEYEPLTSLKIMKDLLN